MRTRFVWLLPPLGVGEPQQGLVLDWRRVVVRASPPRWDALVVSVGRDGVIKQEWVPAMYLSAVRSDPPAAPGRG